MADAAPRANDYGTTIGSDAVFKGDVKFDQNVRLLGKFEGAIETNGDILIAKGAVLEGEIKATNVVIAGQVRGNTHATGKACLNPSANVEGDLTVCRLEMSEGAVFSGQCCVGKDRPAGAPKSAATPRPRHEEPPKPAEPVIEPENGGKKKGLLKQIAGRV